MGHHRLVRPSDPSVDFLTPLKSHCFVIMDCAKTSFAEGGWLSATVCTWVRKKNESLRFERESVKNRRRGGPRTSNRRERDVRFWAGPLSVEELVCLCALSLSFSYACIRLGRSTRNPHIASAMTGKAVCPAAGRPKDIEPGTSGRPLIKIFLHSI